MIEYRFSTTSDRDEIIKLLEECFGKSDKFTSLDYFDGRFYVATDYGRIVAVTGICDEGTYDAPELDWTCVHEAYRGLGLLQSLLYDLLAVATTDIYWDAWGITDSEPNAIKAITALGFELVKKDFWTCKYKDKDCFDDCPFCTGASCHCYTDLYKWVCRNKGF